MRETVGSGAVRRGEDVPSSGNGDLSVIPGAAVLERRRRDAGRGQRRREVGKVSRVVASNQISGPVYGERDVVGRRDAEVRNGRRRQRQRVLQDLTGAVIVPDVQVLGYRR